jgi:digeranylgeranylglycerophospholipid reductase
VGDAAAQVKPTSGGGIVPGLLCARQCALTVNEALAGKSVSSRDLLRYQARWKRVVGREMSWGMVFRRLYRHVSDDRLDSWFSELKKPGVSAAITQYGDIDYPSRVVLPVLAAAPGLAMKVPRALLIKKH